MNKILPAVIFFGFFLQIPFGFTQTLKKKIDPVALQAKIDSVRISGQLVLNFYFRSSDFFDKQALSQKQISKTVAEYEKKIKLNPTAKIYRDYANFLADNVTKDSLKFKAHWRKALDLYLEEIAKNPNNGEVYYNAGILSMKFNDREKAYDYLAKSAELMPDSAKTWAGKGAVLFTYFNNYIDSKADFEKAISLEPKNLDNQVFYLTCSMFESLSKLGQTATFKIDDTYIQKLLKLEPDKLAHQTLAKIAQLMEIFYQTMYQATLTLDNSKDINSFLSVFKGDEKALTPLKTFIEQTIGKRKNNLTMLYNALGLTNLLLQNTNSAVVAFEKAMQLDKSQKAAFDNLAFVYAMQSKYQESAEILGKKEEISLLSNDYEIKAAMINRMKKKQEALQVLEQGLARFPQSPGLKISKGILLYQLKKSEEARNLLYEGLRVNSNDSVGQYFFGLISWQNGKLADAYNALYVAGTLGDDDAKKLLDEYFEAP